MATPPLSTAALRQAADATLQHYDSDAESFRAATADHDVSQNIDALLRHIAGAPPFAILDVGCGPGRDLATFLQRGHRAVGVDGAPRFVEMARATGCEVWLQDFLALDLPPARFDGVFCNASLFHVPRQELPRVLRQLHATLKPGGVLFCSNPAGRTRKAGTVTATASGSIWRHGARCSARPASSNWSITTGRPACRASSSHGWRWSGDAPTPRRAERDAGGAAMRCFSRDCRSGGAL